MNIKTSLLYLHVAELKDILLQFKLPIDGKKIALIQRIIHFFETGNVLHNPKIPEISKARPGMNYPLLSETLILKDAYKNDLVTRMFFKKLIGEYFHFTAFGIDWINERWFVGNPPTYKEFADMWQAEYARRKNSKASPKEEWAYINFTQKHIEANRNASHDEIVGAWNAERARHVAIVRESIAERYNYAAITPCQ